MPFPSTGELLVRGSDPRLALDPADGRNHYLCPPRPEPGLLRFGSSTATTIDTHGWRIASAFRERLARLHATEGKERALRRTTEQIRRTLADLCGLDDKVGITLTESGTFAHRLAAKRICRRSSRPLQILLPQPSETGRGVPEALSLGGRLPLHTFTLRLPDGAARDAAAIDAEVVATAQRWIDEGAALLLVVVDCSKSGLIAPSFPVAAGLRNRFPGRVHLLVDGCQFRFDTERLRRYLAEGAMVAITGSKFYAGPSFSAALLDPGAERTEEPVDNPGLLLRWQVALEAMERLQRLPRDARSAFIADFHTRLGGRLRREPFLTELPAPGGDRTILAFIPGGAEAPFTLEESMALHRMLQLDCRPAVQLGRPFPAGSHPQGGALGALRLSLSAPLVVEALSDDDQHSIVDQAMRALDCTLAVGHRLRRAGGGDAVE